MAKDLHIGVILESFRLPFEEAVKKAVEVGAEGLTVANSGADEPLDAERIFTRFYHSPGNEHSNGLGLPIVAAIANRYGLKVEYSFGDSLHKFKIYK